MDPAVRTRVEGVAAELVRASGPRALSVRSLARQSGLTRSQVHSAIGTMPALHQSLRRSAANEIVGHCLGASSPDLTDAATRECLVECLVKVIVGDAHWALMAFDVGSVEKPPDRTMQLLPPLGQMEPPMVAAAGRFASAALLAVAEVVAATGDEALGERVADIVLSDLGPLVAILPATPQHQVSHARPEPELPAGADVDERILATARQLVRSAGVAAVSMRALAQQTHYGKSTVHAHVVSRTQLIQTLRSQARAEVGATLGRELAGDAPGDELSSNTAWTWAETALGDPEWWLFALERGPGQGGDPAVLDPGLPLVAGWQLVGRSALAADFAARYLHGVTRLVIETGSPSAGALLLAQAFRTLRRVLPIVGSR